MSGTAESDERIFFGDRLRSLLLALRDRKMQLTTVAQRLFKAGLTITLCLGGVVPADAHEISMPAPISQPASPVPLKSCYLGTDFMFGTPSSYRNRRGCSSVQTLRSRCRCGSECSASAWSSAQAQANAAPTSSCSRAAKQRAASAAPSLALTVPHFRVRPAFVRTEPAGCRCAPALGTACSRIYVRRVTRRGSRR